MLVARGSAGHSKLTVRRLEPRADPSDEPPVAVSAVGWSFGLFLHTSASSVHKKEVIPLSAVAGEDQ